ncbi:hypothetical protein [Anaerocolumna sp. MB42-C2]|uniref:hypothetical protein n=1 Tax=Anaerocolumna sp. MB42-C2 TaxID=3070997 RepID=UPI0027E18A2E|nr:hypothetical protein [Anaerocolumna sp. MB42-C2]WMJ86436.1 hypothetical protein RBU59_20705 [Anaerocolumna sp. MB42-C2]
MISPFIISLKNDMFLDLRSDKEVQVFKGLPFDERYCNDADLRASECDRNKVVELKSKLVSKLLVRDGELASMTENIQTIINNGTDCVLRCLVFCGQIPYEETIDHIQHITYKINDIRGRNYGGLIFFIISNDILKHLNTVISVNKELAKDWEYNHITPALLITSENVQRSPEVLHWLRFQSCDVLNKVISSYSNMDTVIDLTEILKTCSITEISETLYKIRMSDGYNRTRLFPFSLHRLLFEPNSIQNCSCSGRNFSSYFDGDLHNGCFAFNELKDNSMCNRCGLSHLCGVCSHAFQDGKCIYREIFEKYYSLIIGQGIRIC